MNTYSFTCVLFSAAQQLFKGTGGVIIKSGVDVAQSMHAFLSRHSDRYETAQEAALHTEPVLITVLVVGVEDLVGYPCHAISIQPANVNL